MTEDIARAIATVYGTPVYVYEKSMIEKKYQLLSNALPKHADIFYSMKSNPSLAVCQLLNRHTERIEVSSLWELQCAKLAGFESENILLSGPGKSSEFLQKAIIGNMMVQAESIGEIKIIDQICKKENRTVNLSIRINANFGLSYKGIAMTGISSQFGVEVEDFEKVLEFIRRSKWIYLKGISIYTGTQILNAENIVAITQEILKICVLLKETYSLKLELVDLGGGFGIPYYGEKELDMRRLKIGLSSLFDEYTKKLHGVQFCFESGRYLTAESGSLLTRVLYIKESKGKKFLICDGGFNVALIASFFSREIRGNFPIRLVCQDESCPRYEEHIYTIAGPLCSPRDILGVNVRLPSVKEGDFISIGNVGAYGLTFSPLLFMSHAVPPEVLIEDNSFRLIREKSTFDDLIRNQISISQEEPHDYR